MNPMKKSGLADKSKFDQSPYIPDVQQDQAPIDPSAVVDPSASMSDPDNDNFVPASKDELKIAVQAMLSDIDDLEIPVTYKLMKNTIKKMREDQNMKKMNTVDETLIRRMIRKVLNVSFLNEAPIGPAPSIASAPRVSSIDTYANDKSIQDLVLSFKPSSENDEASVETKKKKIRNLQKQVERILKSKGLRADVDMIASQVMNKILDPRNAIAREKYLQTHGVTKLDASMPSGYGPGNAKWEKEIAQLRSSFTGLNLDDTEKGVKKEVDKGISLAALRIVKNPNEDPINLVKKTARWLKDNVAGSVGENLALVIQAVTELGEDADDENVKIVATKMSAAVESNPVLARSGNESKSGDVSRDEIAKSIGAKYGTNVRSIEQDALRKFKARIAPSASLSDVELSESVQIAVMYALQDFLDAIPSSGLYSEDDIKVLKSNPSIASELPIFRVFLNSYLDKLDIEEFVENPEDGNIRQIAIAGGLKALKKQMKIPTKDDLGNEVTKQFT
jgi:hypothetical protein